MIERIAIVGLGLMGGSLGLATRKRGVARVVRGYARRAATRRLAAERGAVDTAADSLEDAVRQADFVVFCVPVLAIRDLVAASLPFVAPGAVLTDVGSTKASLATEIAPILESSRVRFVGSHPIAGSEESGIEAAREDLYEDATVVVTPSGRRQEADGPDALRRVETFWRALGARTVVMPPAEHDRLLARTSHLGHLVAAVLAATVNRGAADEVRGFCGTGFRDTTRVASGPEDVWHDIVSTNRQAVAEELGRFGQTLDGVRKMILAGDFEGVRGFLAAARRQREELLSRGESA